MPLIEHGHIVEDRWSLVADDAPLPADRPAIISLARLRAAAAALAGRRALLGVRVNASTPAASLADVVALVALVAIEFPVFRDGRGFTIARHLREHLGFTGEIRAIGHVLPDQHDFLLRTGFTAISVDDPLRAAEFLAMRGRVGIAYQPGQVGGTPLSLLRRRALT